MTITPSSCDSKHDGPCLPPLYFVSVAEAAAAAATAATKTNNNCSVTASNDVNNSIDDTPPSLPLELLSHCLIDYADWGDLAKLACVQKSWSNIVTDAANASTDSKWQLAQALLDGSCGLAKNAARAITLFKELANVHMDETDYTFAVNSTKQSPHAPAMRKIAECYFHGENIEDSTTTTTTSYTPSSHHSKLGMAWLQAAHEIGNDADAAHEMALNYEYGKHNVTVDVVLAAECFQTSAQAGHIEAMAELGLCYELGCGVEQNDETALDWYIKAANEGHVTSKFSVAEAFEEARGVPQSDEEACLWYYRAAVVGDQDSKNALKRLYEIARIVVPGVSALLLNE